MRKHRSIKISGDPAFTLLELMLAVVVVAIVAAVAFPKVEGLIRQSKLRACMVQEQEIRRALCGEAEESGLIGDLERIQGFSYVHLRLGNLFSPTNLVGRKGQEILPDFSVVGFAPYERFASWDPVAQRGWRGPYLNVASRSVRPAPVRTDVPEGGGATYLKRGFFAGSNGTVSNLYFRAGDLAIYDPWGNPYVLQVPPLEAWREPVSEETRFKFARIVSAGPDGVISTPMFLRAHVIAWDELTDEQKLVNPEGARRSIRLAGRVSAASTADRGDDVVLFLNRADVYEE